MKLIFDCDKDEATIIIHAGDFYSALFKVSELVKRELRKDESTKEEILELIMNEIPTIIDEIMWGKGGIYVCSRIWYGRFE